MPKINNTGTQKFKLIVTSAIPFGKNEMLLTAPYTNIAKRLPTQNVHALLKCTFFDTIENHALTCFKSGYISNITIGPLSQKIESIKKELFELISEGLFVSESFLSDEMSIRNNKRNNYTEANLQISSVGMPTCDRPESLKTSITSYIQNALNYGRKPDFTIVDDSKDRNNKRKNYEFLSTLPKKYGCNIFYGDEDDRKDYAKRIAKEIQISPSIIEFALVGNPNYNNKTYGAPRNTLLLNSIDRLAIQVDDDTIGKIAPAPEQKLCLKFTSFNLPVDIRYFDNYETAAESLDFKNYDFLEIHERLLGKKSDQCIFEFQKNGKDIDYQEIGERLLRYTKKQEAHIGLTSIGIVGDSCEGNTNYRLFLNGESFTRLIESNELYNSRLLTRNIIRASQNPCICDSHFLTTTNLGMDNRLPLPPIMPCGRYEDGLLLVILKQCYPNIFTGQLPYVVCHNPHTPRINQYEQIFKKLISVETNHLLSSLIQLNVAPSKGLEYSLNLSNLGYLLKDIASLPFEEFYEIVQNSYLQTLSIKLNNIEKILDEREIKPDYWINDVKKTINILQKSVDNKNFFIPTDITGNVEERRIVFKEIVMKYAQLLTLWPEIISAARKLRNNGFVFGKNIKPA